MLITSSIFLQRRKMSRVTLHPVLKLTKNLPALLQVTPHGWVQTQNSMLTCAIDSLCHNNTKPYEKAVASDQLYSLVSPSFISPLLIATNLFGTFSDPKQAGTEHQWQIALYWKANFCQELAK